MDRRRLRLRARLGIIHSNLALMLGFGCGVFALQLILFVHFFCVPASGAGDTMMGMQKLLTGKAYGETSISIKASSV